MKKFLLSFSVIFLFLAYSLHQRSEGNVVIAPNIPVITAPPPQTTSPNSTTQNAQQVSSGYRDGTYTGNAADAYYGNVQVQIAIQNGKITDVSFLQYPNDRRTSMMINMQAMPYLKQEAIRSQNANVDIVSGATDTSQAFRQSFQAALDQAKS